VHGAYGTAAILRKGRAKLMRRKAVLFVCHAFCSVKSRLASLVLAPSDAAGWFDHCGYQVEVQYL
jgi:hypothetical protein